MGMQGLCSKRRLETGHKQSRTDSFSGNVSDRDAPSPTLQGEEVVVVTADTISGLVEGLAGYARNRQAAWRKECLLDILCTLQILTKRPVKPRVRFRFFEELQECLHVVAHQQPCLPLLPSLQPVNDRLVSLNYFREMFCHLSNRSSYPEFECQSVPYTEQDVIV